MYTMRPVDLRTLTSLDSLSEETIEDYKDYLDIDFRNAEIRCVKPLVEQLDKNLDLSNFYVGYKIPQINKEFDLLRFSSETIINVELKSRNKSSYDIEQQLKKNEYYLKGVDGYHKIILFTYMVEGNKLYRYKDGKLSIQKVTDLQNVLKENIGTTVDIDEKFKPSKYLISPFNDSVRFCKANYFLTKSQLDGKRKILEGNQKFSLIKGHAGTGKTLLLYDIAHNYMNEGKKVLIYHCGMLNDGQRYLNKEGWNIQPVKDYNKNILKEFDIIIFDEIQRIRNIKNVYNELSETEHIKIIMCGDPNQWLHDIESKEAVFEFLENHPNVLMVKLKDKIRNNKSIATFIKQLFNRRDTSSKDKIVQSNIFLKYYDNEQDAHKCIDSLDNQGWKITCFTPSLYNSEYIDEFINKKYLNSHQLIGQEFDRVAVCIGKNFRYENGRLQSAPTYYNSTKMLFENLTRSKEQICLVIVENPDVLRNCLEILNMNSTSL